MENIEQIITLEKIIDSLSNDSRAPITTFEGHLSLSGVEGLSRRSNTLLMVMCKQGSGIIEVNMRRHEIKPGSLLLIGYKSFLGKVEGSSDLIVRGLIISKGMAEDVIPPSSHDMLPLVIHLSADPVVNLNEEHRMALAHIYAGLQRILEYGQTSYSYKKLVCLLRCALYEVLEEVESNAGKRERSRSDDILAQFLHLVTTDFVTHRDVSYYSGKLNITPKHLSTVVKNLTGSTAGDWIERCVIMEAKQLLLNTDLTVQQISLELNFSSQSFFGKYFRNATGVSPKKYRIDNP